MENEIKVKIVGEAVDLSKSVNKAEKNIKRFEKASSGSLKKFEKTSVGASKGVSKLQKSTANANPTLQEFSRVIQDAPFGIQGVGNNITQLAGNFGNLQKSAGGTLPALKQLGASFIGPGGIIFAISAAVSLLTVYGDELLKSADSTGALAKATSKFAAEAKAEVSSLQSLVKIAQDKSNSDQIRQQAIEELNKSYGDYLGNLKLEEINTENTNKAVQRLTRSLIKKAEIQGLEARITEVLDDKSEDLVKTQLELQDAQKGLQSEIKRTISSSAALRSRFTKGLGVEESVKQLKLLSKQLDIPIVGIIQAEGEVNKLSKELAELNSDASKAIQPLEELRGKLKLDDLLLDSQKELEIEGVVLTPEAQAERDKALEVNAKVKSIEPINTSDVKPIEVPVTVSTQGVQGLSKQLEGFDSKLQNTLVLADAFGQGVSNAFDGMISNLMTGWDTASGGFDAFAKNLAKTAIKLIAILLSESIANAIAGATQSGTATGPAAIVSTPAFIATAVGGVLAAFASIPSFATGGIVPGGSFVGDKVPALVNSGEMILNSRQQSNLFSMLDGSFSKVGAGNSKVQVEVTGQIQGSAIRLANTRAGKQNRRFSSGD